MNPHPSDRADVHVAYFFDAGYRYGSVLSAYSVLKHRESPTRITFFTGTALPGLGTAVSALSQAFPQAQVDMRVENILDMRFDTGSYLPAMTYGRLFLPRFLTTGKVLYLDGDTYARRDIGALFARDLDGMPFAGCRDALIERDMLYRNWRWNRHVKPNLAPILATGGLIDPDLYFNTGVMLIDLDRARALGVLDTVFDPETAQAFVSEYGLIFCDQDWLNHIAAPHMFILEPEWNSIWGNSRTAHPPLPLARRRAYQTSRKDPAIVHLAGMGKPWDVPNAKLRRAHRRWQAECLSLMDEMTDRLGTDLREVLL